MFDAVLELPTSSKKKDGRTMPGRLAGKIALISGGATGMGGASSRLFAAEGAKVGVVDRNQEAGRAVVADIEAAGGRAMFAFADVADEGEVNAAVAAVTAALGAPNVLFNHAGSIIIKPFLDTTLADWEWLMAVNVTSMFLMTKAVLPGMIAAGGGSIVCTSSISAVAATPNEVVYNASKGACHMFARSIAVEYRDRNIRCNAVCPGFVRTPHGLREVADLNKLGVDMSDAALAVQQGRICEPEEVARAALFLASDEASFINGAHLFVDNCFTAV
jgi:NAD(P)-dependent dehydrogenase (short-subunit alcohol dehydrogenase family)